MLTVLYFTASWCQPCKVFGPVMERVASEYPHVRLTKVSVDSDALHERQLADRYMVQSLPSVVLLKDDVQTAFFSGPKSESLLTEWFDLITT